MFNPMIWCKCSSHWFAPQLPWFSRVGQQRGSPLENRIFAKATRRENGGNTTARQKSRISSSAPAGRTQGRRPLTPSHRSSRRDCRRMRSPYRSPNEIVGTTNMSIDAMVVGVIVNKGPPTLRRWPSSFRHVLRHGGLADIHAELKEFTVDAGSAP
jgi:hypothetical protein